MRQYWLKCCRNCRKFILPLPWRPRWRHCLLIFHILLKNIMLIFFKHIQCLAKNSGISVMMFVFKQKFNESLILITSSQQIHHDVTYALNWGNFFGGRLTRKKQITLSFLLYDLIQTFSCLVCVSFYWIIFSFQHVYDVTHSCDLDFRAPVSMNSARWLLSPGDGLVYGTNRGDLHVRRPGSVSHTLHACFCKNLRLVDHGPDFQKILKVSQGFPKIFLSLS